MSISETDAGGDILYVTRLFSPGLMNVLCGTPLPANLLLVNPDDANDFVEQNDEELNTTTISTPLFGGNFLDTSTRSEQLISWVCSDPDSKVFSFNYNPVSRKWRSLVEVINPI